MCSSDSDHTYMLHASMHAWPRDMHAPARWAKVVLQKVQQRGVFVLGRLTLPLRQSLEGCRRCGG